MEEFAVASGVDDGGEGLIEVGFDDTDWGTI